MVADGRNMDLADKVWLLWVQEGPYLVRHQHLVAKDEGQAALSPLPIGCQLRGLAKATLDELRKILPAEVHEAAKSLARDLVAGRPFRLVERDNRRAHRSEDVLRRALMALCAAGLVTVFCRNRRRASVSWEIRHVELTNWGRAALISLDAVPLYAGGRPADRPAAADDSHGASNGRLAAASARRPGPA